MALVWSDSCDYYGSNPGTIWTQGNGAAVDLTGTNSRTGIGAIGCSGITAPLQSIPLYTDYFVGLGAKLQSLSFSAKPIQLINSGTSVQMSLQVNSDGSISLIQGPFGPTLATSAGGLVQAGVYAYFELSYSSSTQTASARINGAQVIPPTAFTISGGLGAVNEFTVVGPGGGLTMWIDDIYVCDNTGAHENTFLGPVRLYYTVANADLTPLQFTPSAAGPHFSLVNAVPPAAGATYVSDNVIGQIDQYQFGLPAGLGTVLIKGFKVQLNAEIDSAGSRSIGAQIGASASAGQALTTAYHGYSYMYDVNPNTGVPLLESDFPLSVGPVVTA